MRKFTSIIVIILGILSPCYSQMDSIVGNIYQIGYRSAIIFNQDSTYKLLTDPLCRPAEKEDFSFGKWSLKNDSINLNPNVPCVGIQENYSYKVIPKEENDESNLEIYIKGNREIELSFPFQMSDGMLTVRSFIIKNKGEINLNGSSLIKIITPSWGNIEFEIPPEYSIGKKIVLEIDIMNLCKEIQYLGINFDKISLENIINEGVEKEGGNIFLLKRFEKE